MVVTATVTSRRLRCCARGRAGPCIAAPAPEGPPPGADAIAIAGTIATAPATKRRLDLGFIVEILLFSWRPNGPRRWRPLPHLRSVERTLLRSEQSFGSAVAPLILLCRSFVAREVELLSAMGRTPAASSGGKRTPGERLL